MLYHSKTVQNYLEALKYEIDTNYKNETIKTLYLGGGTPTSLDLSELKQLFSFLKIFKLDNNYEFTVECNIENTTKEKLELFYENGVNRLSFGVETNQPQLLKLLNRKHDVKDVKKVIGLAKKIGFTNLNVDLIYALPGENLSDIKKDLAEILKLDINHLSTYSLILEKNTKLFIDGYQSIDEDLDLEMYNYLVDSLKKKGFVHYEISNFAKEGYEAKHNLVYWNNEHYYGFGLGASGYIDNVRYTNTKNIDKYLKHEFIAEKEILTLQDMMEYEMILGLRKIKGVSVEDFYHKYQQELVDIFPIKSLIRKNLLDYQDEFIFIPKDKLYLSNEVLVNFVGGSNGTK